MPEAPIPGLDDLDELGSDPLSEILEEPQAGGSGHSERGSTHEGSSAEGSSLGTEDGTDVGSLLAGAEGGERPSTAMDEVLAAAAIINLDFIGSEADSPQATDSGVPSGSLGLLDFGEPINALLYLGSTFGSVLFGALGMAFSRVKTSLQSIRPFATLRSFSSLSAIELRAIRTYWDILNSTGSHRLAGSAFHHALGARRVGSDLLRGGSAVELKTALRHVEDLPSVIERASAQSLRDSIAFQGLEGNVPIRIVKVYDMARKTLIVTH